MQLSNITSVALYLAVFSTAGVFAYFGQKKKLKYLCILSILLPALLASLRFTTGTDSAAYRTMYEEIGSEPLNVINGRVSGGGIEPFVVYMSALGNFLHLPPSFLFLIFALITTGSFYFTSRIISEKHPWLIYAMLLFIVFPESLNMMRQLAANGVQAFALAYVFNEHQNGRRVKILPVVLLLLFAISLHYSSLLLLPVFILPVVIKHVRRRTLTLMLFLLIVICIFAFPALLDLVVELGIMSERHYNTFMEIGGSIINIKFFAAFVAAAILSANYHRRRKMIDKQYSLLMLLGVAYAAIGFYSGYLGRLAMFFWIFIIMFVGKLICQLFEKENHRIMICSAVAILYFVLYFCVFGFNQIMPYYCAL